MPRVILNIAFLIMAAAAMAQPLQADSLSAALATSWGKLLRPALVKSYGENPEALNAYAEGVKAAFTTKPEREPFYRGVLEGMQLVERLAQLSQLGVEVPLVDFNVALQQYLVSGTQPMTNDRANEIINAAISAGRAPDTLSLADEQKFLDLQFKRKGVEKLENGLLIETITPGNGTYPSMDSRVSVSYTGRLSDGTIFDQTDQPIILSVARVVAGMQDGLLLMKTGGRYRLFIPPHLGYGPEGIPGIIPGNAVLDFTVDLLGIIPDDEEPILN
ncbi:MAG: FKBP-type peptidyl-prolyl cis-trans isomerase [Muribaculaceae bacterium]|nr:FKBP-type peptidyl-prolyl cis-trans isomerase [Muribaculaceae bacterium]